MSKKNNHNIKVGLWFLITAILLSASSPFRPLAVAPGNDLFANAITISNLSLPYTSPDINTEEANPNNSNPTGEAGFDLPLLNCGGNPDIDRNTGFHSVWFKYTPLASGSLNLDTIGSYGYVLDPDTSQLVADQNVFDTMIGVYLYGGGSLVQIACDDDGAHVIGVHEKKSALTVSLTAGNTYYFAVSSFAGVLNQPPTNTDGGHLIFNVRGGSLPTISGNVGAMGVTLSYTDGTAKTVTSAVDGSYSLSVSGYWSGVVTPSHSCFTFNPVSRSYFSVAANQTSQNYAATLNPSCATADVRIANQYKGTYYLASGQSVTPGYDGLMGGPVQVTSTNGMLIFASERSVFAGTSFNETMGYPTNRLTTEYWFPWYDKSTMMTRVLIGDPNAIETARVELYIGGVYKETFNILPYGNVTPGYDGLVGGPVRVLSIPNGNGVTVPIFASERAVYAGVSFDEMMGYPANRLTTEYWFPWYDKKSMVTDLVIGNTDGVETAKVEVYIAGEYKETLDILPYESATAWYDGVMGGPVRVLSIPNVNGVTVPVVASERSVYKGTSFNETMGFPTNQLTTEYWFPWYDKKSMMTRVLIGNPDEVEPARVELYIGGVYKETFNIVPYGSVTPGYDGVMGGPVRVLSIPNVNGVTVPIFTSERSVFAGVSFNETMGYPANQLTTEYWFPWYDKKSMITRVLIGRP